MKRVSFRELYCAARGCVSAEFEERAFWECLYPRGVFVARVLWRWQRKFFTADLELLRLAGGLTGVSDLKAEISNFRYHHPARGILRGTLRVRVSGQKLLDLAVTLFQAAQ
jgi:hypothetical protein